MDDVLTIGDVVRIGFLVWAVVLLFSTIITWLLSKKFPTVWFLNKTIAGIYLTVLAVIVSGLWINSLPSVVFSKVTGFYPPAGVKNLQAVSEWHGELEQKHLTFSADQETLKTILGKCFYEITEAEALKNMNYGEPEQLEEFTGNARVRFYERPSRDVGNCLGDFSSSYIAYDEESGKTYLQWNYVHF